MCAHSWGISSGPLWSSCLCSQVELRRRTAVEQIQLHQHALVCGRGARRARRGDSHHDVSRKKTEEQQIAGVFKCALSRVVTRACAASIYSSALFRIPDCAFSFSWIKRFLSRSSQHQNWLSADYDHRRSMLQRQPDCPFEEHEEEWSKNAWENRRETLFLYKVLTALESGERHGDDLACPQKSDLWRFLLCSFKCIIRTAQSRSACICYDAALLPYWSRDLGLWDVLPQPLHQCFMIPAINDRLTAGCGVGLTGEWYGTAGERKRKMQLFFWWDSRVGS